MCTSKFLKLCVVLNEGICVSDEKIVISRFHVFQTSRLGNLEIL